MFKHDIRGSVIKVRMGQIPRDSGRPVIGKPTFDSAKTCTASRFRHSLAPEDSLEISTIKKKVLLYFRKGRPTGDS